MARKDDYNYDNDYDYEEESGGSQINRILVAFVIGGVISSVITMFITPTSGPQIRRTMKHTVDEAKSRANQARDAVETAPRKAKSLANDAAETARRRAAKLKDVGEKVLDEQKQSLRHGLQEASDVIQNG